MSQVESSHVTYESIDLGDFRPDGVSAKALRVFLDVSFQGQLESVLQVVGRFFSVLDLAGEFKLLLHNSGDLSRVLFVRVGRLQFKLEKVADHVLIVWIRSLKRSSE